MKFIAEDAIYSILFYSEDARDRFFSNFIT